MDVTFLCFWFKRLKRGGSVGFKDLGSFSTKSRFRWFSTAPTCAKSQGKRGQSSPGPGRIFGEKTIVTKV
jgi:hypothetical protein